MKYDICVVGGCSIDRIFFVNDKGNYEKNPDIINFGGKGANQAIAASRAGSNVIIISRLGKGAKGELILNNLINNKVVTSSIDMIENLENDMANIFVDDKSKDNKIDRIIEATDSFTIDLIKNSKELILNSKYVVTSTKLPKEVYEYLINYCYENSIPTVITPSIPAKISIKENKKIN